MFDHPQKSVVRSPFRIYPKPAWFAKHKNLLQLGQRVTAFEAYPTWGKLLVCCFRGTKGIIEGFPKTKRQQILNNNRRCINAR